MAFKWKSKKLIMIISAHAFFATLPAPFTPAGWQLSENSTFDNFNINTVTVDSAANLYLAGGQAGRAAISENFGVTWTSVDTLFSENSIFSSAYANGIFIVGGSTGKLATSDDGVSWTLRNSGFGASPILGITYFSPASLWVIVGGSGKLATSSDGINWILRSSSFGTSFINDVSFSDSLLVAAGYSGKLATSSNGIDWVQRTSSFVFDTIHKTTFNSTLGKYVAVGDLGKVASSPDGINWTQVFPSTSFNTSSIRSVGSNSVGYLAGGSLGKIATAFEENSWTQRISFFNESTINDVYLSENSAIAVGDSGKIAYSV